VSLRDSRLNILIATPFEPENVDLITEAIPEGEVVFRPDLLPTARYTADHGGDASRIAAVKATEWASLLAEAEVMLSLDLATDGGLRTRAPKLRWVQGTSSGMADQVRRSGLLGSDVIVTTAAGIHAGPLSEWVLMAALYFAKRVPMLRRWQTELHWERFAVGELAGRRAVLLGVGAVGRKVAATLSAVGVEVAARRRRADAEEIPGVARLLTTRDQWEAALSAADFVVIAAPATPETRHLLGPHEIALLGPEAVVINIGRGWVVDQNALIDALQKGKIGGAALDVFEEEPLPSSSPLWKMENVLISPHSASTVPAENRRIAALFANNIRRYSSGQPLINRFDPARRY